MTNKSWQANKERSNPFLLKLICWIALNLSRPFARFWLYPITLYFFLTSPKVRFASKHYLKRTHLQKTGFIQIIKHIYYFSAVVLDRVYFITGRTVCFDVKIVNEALMTNLVDNKVGFIMLGAHIGGFDVLQYLTSKYGQARFMMDIGHNSMITDVLYNLNPTMMQAAIDANNDNALLKAKEYLDNGEFVAILADRYIDKKSAVRCVLLNDNINIPKAPFALASVLKKPIIVFFGVYLGANKYQIHFEKLTHHLNENRVDRDENITKNAQQYVAYIQNMVEKHPFNWFNFYDFWGDLK